MLTTARRVVGAIAVLTAIGCGDDDGNGPTGSISLAATPTALTLDPGTSGTVSVTLTRGGGFADPVTVAVEGLPTGVTATVSPTQLTGAATQATVTVTVAAAVAAGTYTATVRGSAAGVGNATTQYTLTVTAQPNYTLSLSQTPITVAPGGTGQTTVNIARTNFTGAVTFSLDAPPAGITATFSPAAPTTSTSVATISVASTVPLGSYNVTIKGAATGVTPAGDRTTTLAVTVAPVPDFTLAAAPNAGSAAPGGSTNSTITITRSNLTADIALSLVNPPAGITGVFAPATLSGATLLSTLTLNVASTVQPGNYAVTVQGTGGGVTKTTVFNLSVATSGGNLVWEFCNSDDLPLRFWRLSGGTWTEVAPTTVGNTTRYTFNITSNTGGIAFTISNTGAAARIASRIPRARTGIRSQVRDARNRASAMRMASRDVGLTSPYFDTFVLFGLASELGTFAETCGATTNTVAKTFNLTGQAANEEGMLGYGGAAASLQSTTPSYVLNVVPGTYDWMAIWGPAPSQQDLSHNWQAYRIGRAEAAPGAAVAVNRTGATAFAQFPFTVSGGAQGSFFQFNEFFDSQRGEVIGFPIGSLLSSTGSGTMLFPATADRLATDMWQLGVANTAQTGNNVDFRTTLLYLGSGPPASGAFALPASVPAFTVTQVQGAPVGTWQAAGAIPAAYQTSSSVIQASFTGNSALYSVAGTRGWLTANGFTTNYTLAAPTLPNFTAAWLPTTLTDATVIMFGSNFATTPVAGSIANLSLRMQSPP